MAVFSFKARMASAACLFAGAVALGAAPEIAVETAGPEPGEDFTETLAGHLVSFEMVAVAGGSIQAPDPAKEGEPIEVEVGPFWIGKHEVRWDEFAIFALGQDMKPVEFDAAVAAESRPSRVYGILDRGFAFQGNPAIGMTYQAAKRYCEWLSEKTGRTYRLPTEAEWIWASRAGGEAKELEDDELKKIAWHRGNSGGAPRPVGTLKPNAWGLHDMLGNVAEWATGIDGKPVALGGSFLDDAKDVQHLARRKQTFAWQASDPQFPPSQWWLSDAPFVGLRVVREP